MEHVELLSQLGEIKKRYEAGENLVQYLNQRFNSDNGTNSLDAIAISYDMQAGAYTRFAEQNIDYKLEQTACLAKVLDALGPFDSLVEAGVGECTTLAYMLKHLTVPVQQVYGFDLSWSRLRFGREFMRRLASCQAELFTGNLFQIPLQDNSVDVVYTFHSIEPNGGREREALQELYRVARKYVVLCEPAYDFASEAAKQRMKDHGFTCDIYPSAVELGYKVLEHRLFDVSYNELNPTGLTIIEKRQQSPTCSGLLHYACPITKTPLERFDDCFFSHNSLLAYPILSGIPCLLAGNAIMATHFDEFAQGKQHRS